MCVCSSQPTSVYITGYGIDTEYPEKGLEGVEQLQPNQYITLVEGEDQEHDNNWDKIKLTGVGWGGRNRSLSQFQSKIDFDGAG